MRNLDTPSLLLTPADYGLKDGGSSRLFSTRQQKIERLTDIPDWRNEIVSGPFKRARNAAIAFAQGQDDVLKHLTKYVFGDTKTEDNWQAGFFASWKNNSSTGSSLSIYVVVPLGSRYHLKITNLVNHQTPAIYTIENNPKEIQDFEVIFPIVDVRPQVSLAFSVPTSRPLTPGAQYTKHHIFDSGRKGTYIPPKPYKEAEIKIETE